MPSTSERSFGQRYTKAAGLLEYLKLIPVYAPDNPEIETANFETFLASVLAANQAVGNAHADLMNERTARIEAYKGEDGLIVRCMKARDYVASIDDKGKQSVDYKKIGKIITLMRGKKLSKNPDPPAEGETTPKTISTSEQSYGSVLAYGYNILEILKVKPGYAPTNPDLTIANLTTFLDGINALNKSVHNKQAVLDNAIEERAKLYVDLQGRIQKIKMALASQFGKQSNEYKDSLQY